MRRILAIFFTLLILVSGANVTLGTHFCGGTAVDSQLMLGHQHLDCGMSGMDSKKEGAEDRHETMLQSGCCNNEYVSLLTDTNFKLATLKVDYNWSFIPVPEISLLALELLPLEISGFEEYSPPILRQDFTVLHQSFLI